MYRSQPRQQLQHMAPEAAHEPIVTQAAEVFEELCENCKDRRVEPMRRVLGLYRAKRKPYGPAWAGCRIVVRSLEEPFVSEYLMSY